MGTKEQQLIQDISPVKFWYIFNKVAHCTNRNHIKFTQRFHHKFTSPN